MCRFNKKLVVVITCLIVIITLSGCSKTPDTAKDYLAKAYKNMSEVKSFSMSTKLVMDTSMSGINSSMVVNTEVAMNHKPFELTIVQNQQGKDGIPTTNYMYTRQKGPLQTFLYEKGKWNKIEMDEEQFEEQKMEYNTPVDFGLYFNEVDSFAITSSKDKVIVLEGTVSGDNMVNVLRKTGALKQLSLSSFPEKELEDARPIKVKASLNADTVCLTKVSIDMADTYQDLSNLLFGEDSLVNPKINQCTVELNNIKLNQQYEISMPEDIKLALKKML